MNSLAVSKKTVMLLLSILGLVLSLFLAYEYSLPGDVTCAGDSVGGNGCEVVRSSEYSYVGGVRLPLLGSLYFLALTVYLMFRHAHSTSNRLEKTILTTTLAGAALYEFYLMFVQISILNSVCLWCSLLGLIVFIMFIYYLLF